LADAKENPVLEDGNPWLGDCVVVSAEEKFAVEVGNPWLGFCVFVDELYDLLT
jgi:hypothetical protein